MNKIILICGDRHWDDKEYIRTVIRNQMPNEVIVGDASGADKLAERCCLEDGFTVTTFNAEWDKYGDGAGPIRNRKMLDVKPTLVIAFHDDLFKSKGTWDTICEAKRRGIPFMVVNHGYFKT